MKTQYKSDRQRIEGNVIFCHGESDYTYKGHVVKHHVDAIMKSFREITDDQLQEGGTNGFAYPLIYLREASRKEINLYCIKK